MRYCTLRRSANHLLQSRDKRLLQTVSTSLVRNLVHTTNKTMSDTSNTLYTSLPELQELPNVSCLKTLNLSDSIACSGNPLKYAVIEEGYTVAFDCSSLHTGVEDSSSLYEEMMSFYNAYGFVVCKGLYNSEECEATRDAMWSILEDANPGMKRDDRESWNALKSKGKYGLSTRGPSFHPVLVKNR